MYRVVTREDLAPEVHLFRIDAPAVARKALPGQFVILRIHDRGERIPLTVADYDRDSGLVTIVFMEVGKTTHELACLEAGDSIANLVGPLGVPAEVENFGTVVCVSGGFAAAIVLPVARAMKQAGNKVVSIMGARCADLLFWADKMGSISDELIIVTDDGTCGRKALVTEPLKEVLERERVDRVVAIGPTVMMKFCSRITQPSRVKTIVSLNPIMLDGTGMCGVCRVSVGEATKFACVDGPDFDGHLVDWDQLLARRCIYVEEESCSLEAWKGHACQCA